MTNNVDNKMLELIPQTYAQVATIELIEKFKQEYGSLTVQGIDDKAGLAKVEEAHKRIKTVCAEVEKTRKGLKESALVYGRAVDTQAKELMNLLEPIRDHLEGERKRIDSAKAEAKLAKERAEQERIQTRIDILKSVGLKFDGAAWCFPNDDRIRILPINLQELTDVAFGHLANEARTIHDDMETAAAVRKSRLAAITAYGLQFNGTIWTHSYGSVSIEVADEMLNHEFPDDRFAVCLENIKNATAHIEEIKAAELKAQQEQQAEKERLEAEAAALKAKQEELDKQERDLKAARDKVRKSTLETIGLRHSNLEHKFVYYSLTTGGSVTLPLEAVDQMTDTEFDEAVRNLKSQMDDIKAQEEAQKETDRKKAQAEAELKAKEELDAKIAREAQEKADAERLKSDTQKLKDLAKNIEELTLTIELSNPETKAVLVEAQARLSMVAKYIKQKVR